ncbi:MAG TPA: hypothetical protein VHY59_10725, partial [Chthoniobacterales bacterium]|nr:hypothetical protein [Chthoniobacterales bacterium]
SRRDRMIVSRQFTAWECGKRTPSRRDGVTRRADWFTAQGGKLSLARNDQTVPNGTGLFS